MSRQTRKEFLPVYYGTHGLAFAVAGQRVHTESASEWLRVFGPEAFRWLRRFKLYIPYSTHGTPTYGHTVFIAFGETEMLITREYIRKYCFNKPKDVPKGIQALNFWICGLGKMEKYEEQIAAFLHQRIEANEIEANEEVRLTLEDFEDLVCELARWGSFDIRGFRRSRDVYWFRGSKGPE